jgi:hypothetical protein
MTRTPSIRFIKLVLATALLSACAVGPHYTPPKPVAPATWTHSPTAAQEALHLNNWWQSFHDPVLDNLIQHPRSPRRVYRHNRRWFANLNGPQQRVASSQ